MYGKWKECYFVEYVIFLEEVVKKFRLVFIFMNEVINVYGWNVKFFGGIKSLSFFCLEEVMIYEKNLFIC